jgi:hypothetical protein
VVQFKKLEFQNLPPEQKLQMLQNTISDVADLYKSKQLNDPVVARGGTHHGFKEYLELLL